MDASKFNDGHMFGILAWKARAAAAFIRWHSTTPLLGNVVIWRGRGRIKMLDGEFSSIMKIDAPANTRLLQGLSPSHVFVVAILARYF